jgi:hypothetical protein
MPANCSALESLQAVLDHDDGNRREQKHGFLKSIQEEFGVFSNMNISILQKPVVDFNKLIS